MKYTPELDGIRALSILLVIVSHVGLGKFIPGGLGVTIFFFISGYLITGLLLSEANTFQKIDLKKFYIRRFWRLLPPALFFIAISSISIYYINGFIKPAEVIASVFYLANYYKVLFHFSNMGGVASPFNILWSLAVEEHFYILFAPLLAYTFSSRLYVKIICVFLAVPLLIRFFVAVFHPELVEDGGYNYTATETRIDTIAFGCFLAYLKAYRESALYKLLDFKCFILGIFGVCFTLIVRDSFFRETLRYSMQNLSIFLVIANILFNSEKLFILIRAFLSRKVLTFLGKLSYSLYLQHWFVLTMVCYLYKGKQYNGEWQFLFWVFTGLFSLISYFFIEQPTLAYRRKFGSNV